MEIRSKTLGTIIVIVIFGGIFGASVLGLWKTESVRNPNSVQRNQLIGETSGENVGTGTLLPADIRGNHRFGEISEIFDIPLEILSLAFALPPDVDPVTFNNQNFDSIYPKFEGEQEIGNGSVKWFVALYTGLPFEFEDEEEATYLLRPAVDILKSQADLTSDQIDYLDAHVIEIEFEIPDSYTTELELQSSAEEKTELKQDEKVVVRKTTFADLLEWGVPAENIETIIGGEIPNQLMLVYDYCIENGISFGVIKIDLQVEVDELGP